MMCFFCVVWNRIWLEKQNNQKKFKKFQFFFKIFLQKNFTFFEDLLQQWRPKFQDYFIYLK